MGELLPCPFCGSEAEIIVSEDDDGRFAAVSCPKCGAGSRQHYFCGEDAREFAADAWNTRPRTEGRGEGEPVAYMMKTAGSGSRPVLPSYVYAWREKGVSVDAQPLYASPIREPEISREAVASLTSEQIARAIAASYGVDPDDDAPLSVMCTAENGPVPWWKVYQEQADAILNLAHATHINKESQTNGS